MTKLICSQSDLNTHLSLISRVVPSRPTHPVLANVLFETDAETQQVHLTAFDLSLGLRTGFAAQVSQSDRFTLPAKLLSSIVARFSEGEITLESEVEEEEESDPSAERVQSAIAATLTSASGRYQLRGLGAEDYPELPEVEEDGGAIVLPVEMLLEGLGSTLFAASIDENKQVLKGVRLCCPHENLEFAATDGHRLAMLEADMEAEDEDGEPVPRPQLENPEEFAVTIPARALKELERLLSSREKGTTVTLRLDESQAIFEIGEQRLTSRKLEGTFPDYHSLIPSQFSKQVDLDRRRLLSSLELVSVLADQKNNVVKFSIDSDGQQLSLSVDAQDVGQGRETMPAQVTGDSMDIAFNVKYLLDGLKALRTDEIQMHLNGGNQSVIFTPVGGLKMTYLVMPVQLR